LHSGAEKVRLANRDMQLKFSHMLTLLVIILFLFLISNNFITRGQGALAFTNHVVHPRNDEVSHEGHLLKLAYAGPLESKLYSVLPPAHPAVPRTNPLIDGSNTEKRRTWDRTFGGPLADKAYDIAVLSDGSVVMVGHTRALKGIGHDVLIFCIDRNGETIWHRTFGGLGDDHAYGVVPSGDEDIIIAGFTRSKGSGESDLWVCRLNKEGDLIWEHTYGGVLDDRARTIAPTQDGGCLVAGSTQSSGSPEGDAWVIKINQYGQRVWEQTFGGDGEDGIFQVKMSANGSFFATGYTDVGELGGFDLWILKIDTSGKLIWEQTFGKSHFDSGTAVEPTSDGGCIVAGLTSQKGYQNDQVWMLRLDARGKLLWQHVIGGNKNDNAWAMLSIDNFYYIVVCATSSRGSGSADAWIICIDINGKQIWERIYGGRLWDRPTSASMASDGGFFVGGYTTTKGFGFEDFWLLRLDPKGNL
jgi:uncharacterized delta-60 repeat protein